MKIKSHHLLIITLLVIVIVATGCFKKPKVSVNNNPSDNFTEILAAQSQIKKFSSAEELQKYFASRPPVSGSGSGYGSSGTMRDMAVKEAAPQAATGAPIPLGFGGDSANQPFSGTNVQVSGVDEGDIVKTDGSYMYIVKDQSLNIIKAVPASDMNVTATISLEGNPQELYIKDNTLAVFGYSYGTYNKMAANIRPFASETFFALYDITDRSKPTLLRRLDLEGSYTSSRLIDNRLYFITANYNYYPFEDTPLPRVRENNAVISDSKTTDKYIYPTVYYIETPSQLNATTVTIFDFNDIQAPVNSQVFLMPAGETVYASTNALYLAYTKYVSEYVLRMTVAKEILSPRLNDRERQRIEVISNLDPFIMSEDEKLAKVNQIIEAFISRLSPEQQKSISQEIETEFLKRHPDLANELEKTVVHKIAFSNGSLNYVGSGEVTGRLLNQYSLDEQAGNLRLATTRSQSWFTPFMPMMDERMMATSIMPIPTPEVSNSINNVYVLDQSLKAIGQLENLAPGERIYSVRFMGDRAYLVTFRQTDPLFVIDLSTPEKPAVLGQIKIPGFSNYLHPYDDHTLIGLGKEAIDKGEQGVDVLGLKVSLFDVSSPTEPKELSSIILGGRGSDSLALFDYKAFLFNKDKNLLVIPASLTSKTVDNYQTEFQGSIVFTVTNQSITERGRIAFKLPNEMSSQTSYIDDTVRRNLFISDVIYSVSPATLKASQMTSTALIKSLSIPSSIRMDNPVPPSLPYETPSVPPIRK